MSVTSIRHRLLLHLTVALCVTTSLVGLLMYLAAKDELNEIFDKTMIHVALTLQAHSNPSPDEPSDALKVRKHPIKKDERFLLQLWSPSGELLYSSYPDLHFPLPQHDGIQNITVDDETWRSLVLVTPTQTIHVAKPMRRDMAAKVAWEFLIPVVLQIPVLGLVIWIVVGYALRPLSIVSHAIAARTPKALEPLSHAEAPLEIHPIISALNDLLKRLDHAIILQREFTADAAHALRTPLTAVQLQMNNLQRTTSDEERNEAMEKLSGGIQRSIHVVQQLLSIARQDPGVMRTMEEFDLSHLARKSVEQAAAHAASKSIDLGISKQDSVFIHGAYESISVLLGNLLDNAIRYTPPHGRIDVAIYREGAQAILEISDNGIGIARKHRARVFDRFFRISGNETPGTGLGLAIVQSIADSHQASLSIHDGLDGKGVMVRVVFG